MTPTEPGYYWATPKDEGEREHVRAVSHEGIMYGLAIRNLKAPFIFIREAHAWTDWHGPIVEQCAKCLCGKVFSADEGGAWITCPACGGSGRRR